jgi:hypothetical protein
MSYTTDSRVNSHVHLNFKPKPYSGPVVYTEEGPTFLDKENKRNCEAEVPKTRNIRCPWAIEYPKSQKPTEVLVKELRDNRIKGIAQRREKRRQEQFAESRKNFNELHQVTAPTSTIAMMPLNNINSFTPEQRGSSFFLSDGGGGDPSV